MATLIDLVCTNCNTQFQREKRQVTSSKLHEVKRYFCCRSCSVAWNNRNKQATGDRSSLIERWILQRIKEKNPTLIVEPNRKDLLDVGGELDIYIPAYSLAFEVQGKSHFLPIWGEDVLRNTKANDELKRQAAQRAGIELVEIDVSELSGVRDPKFEKILNQVFFVLAVKGIF